MSRTLLFAAVFVSSSLIAPGVLAQPTITDPNYAVTVHASGFTNPTGIRFLNNNPTDFFVIEKNTGRVQRHLNGTTMTALDLTVEGASERGLLGIEIDPNFAAGSRVYLYHSTTTGPTDTNGGTPDPWVDNRLTSHTWSGTSLGGPTLLRTFGTAADGQATGPNHDAGPFRFGPDGKLYGTTGDLNRNRAEQNNLTQASSSAIVGGIYRINTDGTVPADNPFATHATTEFRKWYAYGVRNTFGLAFDPLTGNLWDTENGPNAYDEVNLVARGFNSGWNKIMGPDARDAQNQVDLVHLPGSSYSDPEFSWLSPVAPTAICFLANSVMDGEYRDAALVSDNNNGAVYLFRLNTARTGFVLGGGLADLVADDITERNSVRLGTGFGAANAMEVGPDGGIYLTSYINNAVYRIGAPSWKTNGNSTWGNVANWVGSGVPSGANAKANFFGTITAPRTVLNDAPRVVGSLTFNSDHRYTVSGASTLGLDVTTPLARVSVLKGSHTIGTMNFELLDNTVFHVRPATSTLSIAGQLLASNVAVTKEGAGVLEVNNVRAQQLTVTEGTLRVVANGGAAGVSKVTGVRVATLGTLDIADNDLLCRLHGPRQPLHAAAQLCLRRPRRYGRHRHRPADGSNARAGRGVRPERDDVARPVRRCQHGDRQVHVLRRREHGRHGERRRLPRRRHRLRARLQVE